MIPREEYVTVRGDRIVVSYRNLFRRQAVLSEVSMVARPGEVTAVVGPNGAGKTTLFSVLMGFMRPDAGVCTIAGMDPARYRQDRGIAYLPETLRFPPGWTVGRLLARAADLSCPPANRVGTFESTIQRAGLETETLSKLVRSCSKGTQRRIAFAWALAGDPRVIVVDEPFSGLDPASRVSLRRQLHAARQRGCTVLMASHELAEVEQLADTVLIMQRGRLRSAAHLKTDGQSLAAALASELAKPGKR